MYIQQYSHQYFPTKTDLRTSDVRHTRDDICEKLQANVHAPPVQRCESDCELENSGKIKCVIYVTKIKPPFKCVQPG